jgi:GSH-dependent disulfide-bond oxidoreductase
MFELYFFPTPNSRKVTILLEECGAPYSLTVVHLGRGDQFHPDFLRISPNNRMPALVDTEPRGGGPISIFESAAIMMYVAEKLGRFWPQDARGKYEVTQWMFWQMANQGPKMGEQGHFQRADNEKKHGDLTYPIARFDNEVRRLFGVLNLGLFGKNWLAADQYTIADMICYPWAALWKSRGIDLDEFPNVKRWLAAIGERPAVVKSGEIGQDIYQGQDKMAPDERERFVRMLSNQRAVPVPREWHGPS